MKSSSATAEHSRNQGNPRHHSAHRERRFRRPRQALGLGYESFDVYKKPSASTSSKDQPGLESEGKLSDSENPAELQASNQPALSGLQFCGKLLLAALLFLCLGWITCSMLDVAAASWMSFRSH